MPFTARILPSSSSSRARSMVARMNSGERSGGDPAPGSSSHSRGPQSKQLIGWAWWRRFPESAYSAAQAEHRGKSRMVVFGRS